MDQPARLLGVRLRGAGNYRCLRTGTGGVGSYRRHTMVPCAIEEAIPGVASVGCGAPVGRDDLIPLPGEDLEIVRRPRTGDPVGCGGLGRVAGAAGEIDDDGDAEFFRQQDGLATDIAVVRGANRIRVERVAVATERADGDAAIGEELLNSASALGSSSMESLQCASPG